MEIEGSQKASDRKDEVKEYTRVLTWRYAGLTLPERNYISPNPDKWQEIHNNLVDYWNEHMYEVGIPPKPLIQGGWMITNDAEKERMWTETLLWAKYNSCEHLLPEITAEDQYYG